MRGGVLSRVEGASRSENDVTSYADWRDALVEVLRVPVDDVPAEDLEALFAEVLDTHESWEAAGRPGGSGRETIMAMTDELLSIADELYALGLGDFTPARDAKVKELKGTDLAPQVKALRKPSVAAWVVNLLVRLETEQVEQVLTVGTALREAQASMSGDELRALTKQRRQLTAAVTTRARALAREHGQKVTESVADQVEATLTASMVDEGCAAAVRSGLLVAALSATGVDEVELDRAVAVPEALGFEAAPREAPAPAKPDLRVVPDPDQAEKARKAAQEELDAAEEALAEAGDSLESAAAELAELEARSMQVQAEIDELKRRIAELEETADEVDDAIGEAEDARDGAQEAVAEATRERDAAADKVARLAQEG